MRKAQQHFSSRVEQQEILQYFISLFPSLKSNSWHLEAIWSRSMGLTPVVICLTALGDGQGRCACVCVCMHVRELVGRGLSEEEPGDGNSTEEYKPHLMLTGNLESRSGFTSVAGFRATCYKVRAPLYCCCCLWKMAPLRLDILMQWVCSTTFTI